jgi:hypothetical protein
MLSVGEGPREWKAMDEDCGFNLRISLSSLLVAQSPTPLKTIDLNRVKIYGQACESKWREGLSRVIWLDDQHFAAFHFAATCSDAREVAVFDSAGFARAAARLDGLLSVSRGPRGTIAGVYPRKIELLDTQLRLKQRLDCPNGPKGCWITLAPNSALNSEFAVCSHSDAQQVCEFYRDWPAEKVSSGTTAISGTEDPYTHAVYIGHPSWQVGNGETWSFDNGQLTRAGVGKASSLVSSKDFVGKNGGHCEGQLSASEPRRFLAVCTGTHWYSDGMLDAIFGFSRVVLFEVPSGHQVMRVNGPAFTSAALSPLWKENCNLKR